MENAGNKKMPKNADFVCELCHFKCYKKSNWETHVKTIKHIERLNGKKSCFQENKTCQEFFCDCGKKYLSVSGLWKHKKTCDEISSATAYDTKETTTDPTIETGNKDEFIKYLLKENSEFKNIVMEVIKNGTNNTTNNTNTTNMNNSNNNNNNKTFNLQFFLNETCKDAMNLMDFVQDIVLTLNDLEETGRIGFAEGISKMINNRLKALDVTQRPIHCSDLKRETLYIKNENKWEKEEDSKPQLTNAVKHIAGKNMMQIFDWQKAHPDYNDPETRTSDKYMKMLTNVMSGGTEEEIQQNYEKIIKNIIKETAIMKENFLI
jgi:hypothetical protein